MITSPVIATMTIELILWKDSHIEHRCDLGVLAVPFKRIAQLATSVKLDFRLSGYDRSLSLSARRAAMKNERWDDVQEIDAERERVKASIIKFLPDLSSEGRLIFS